MKKQNYEEYDDLVLAAKKTITLKSPEERAELLLELSDRAEMLAEEEMLDAGIGEENS